MSGSGERCYMTKRKSLKFPTSGGSETRCRQLSAWQCGEVPTLCLFAGALHLRLEQFDHVAGEFFLLLIEARIGGNSFKSIQ